MTPAHSMAGAISYPSTIYLDNGQALRLDPQPFAQGGQGAVFRFDRGAHPTLRLRVAKLYKDVRHAARDEARIRHMCATRPDTSALANPECLVWPEEPLFDGARRFVGYVMPLVREGRALEELCTPSGARDSRFRHFLGPGTAEVRARMQVARNVLDALRALDAAGDYVLTDFKPDNVVVKPDGVAYLVDLDALQVASSGSVLFPATGYTDEYPPPEFYRNQRAFPAYVPKSFERFSMAVVLYRLLLNIHPFMGTTPTPGLLDNIAAGYFANGRHRRVFRVVPPPHKAFWSLPAEFRQLFTRCFDDGTDDPSLRPSAAEWIAAFDRAGVKSGHVTPHQRRNVRRAQIALTIQTAPPRAPVAPPPPPPRLPVQAPAPAPQVAAPTYAGIWHSAFQTPAYLDRDVEVVPTAAAPVVVTDSDADLVFRVIAQDLVLRGSTRREIVGKRVHVDWIYSGRESLLTNFADRRTRGMWSRIWYAGAPVPPSGSATRDIYGAFTFTFEVKLSAAHPWWRRLVRRRVSHKVDVPKNSFARRVVLAPAGQLSSAATTHNAAVPNVRPVPLTAATPLGRSAPSGTKSILRALRRPKRLRRSEARLTSPRARFKGATSEPQQHELLFLLNAGRMLLHARGDTPHDADRQVSDWLVDLGLMDANVPLDPVSHDEATRLMVRSAALLRAATPDGGESIVSWLSALIETSAEDSPERKLLRRIENRQQLRDAAGSGH